MSRIILFCLSALSLGQVIFAQVDTSQMVYTRQFVITDAVGNRDTVITSYSNRATDETDTELGEINIADQPYDSILDARIVSTFDVRGGEIDYAAKHAVGFTFNSGSSSRCFERGYTDFQIVVYAKYMPVTVSWDSTFYADPNACRSQYVMTDNLTFEVTDGPWFLVPTISVSCLAYTSRYLLTGQPIFGEEPDSDYIRQIMGRFIVPVLSGDTTRLDTLHSAYFEVPLFFGNCPDLSVGTSTPASPPVIAAYPNPTTSELNIPLPSDPAVQNFQLKIISSAGAVVAEKNLTTSQINVSQLPKGYYYFRLTGGNGRVYTGRFVHLGG